MKFNNKNIFIMFLPLLMVLVFMPFTPAHGAAMGDYCITPPFVAKNVTPNVLFILDNSGSMNCLAYSSSYNPSVFSTGQYYGYFDPARNYKYSTAVTPNRWIPTNDPLTNGTAASPIASGNLLNWITMSRQDISKKILIGGRASSGAYNAADRTTNPVKLYGNSDPQSSYSCVTDHKAIDTSPTGSYPNLIYPFNADYTYTVATSSPQNTFTVTFNDPATLKLYPNSNYTSFSYSFPAAWARTPSTSAAWQTVDETTANTTDYIRNNSSAAAQALFGYNKSDPSLATASGPISSITVYAYAEKNSTNTTLYLQGLLALQQPGPNMIAVSGLSALSKNSWSLMSFNFPINPQTGAAWTWSDLTDSVDGSLLGFGVQAVGAAGADPTSSVYATVSQVYIQVNVSAPTSGGPYNIIVDQGSTPATGVLDSMATDVRFGLFQYNSSDGGHVSDYLDYSGISGMISTISGMLGSTNTPLSETLYEAARYFRQDSTYYSSSDYTKGCTGATSGTSTCGAGSTPTAYDPYYFVFSDPSIASTYVPCAKSYVIILTDGEPTQDQNIPGTATSAPYSACTLTNIKACSGFGGPPTNPNPRFAGTPIGKTYSSSGTDYLIDVAYWAHTNDMRPGTETDVPTTWRQSLPGIQNLNLYTVFLFGSGSTLLKDAAIYGGFNDLNGNNKPDCTVTPAECYRDTNGDGVISSDGSDDPISYYEGEDGYQLSANITKALLDILRRATSGTAASVLASGEGSGANLIQAVFYPQRKFSNATNPGGAPDVISWIGRLTNLWYYVDPFLNNSTIREDNGCANCSLATTNAAPWSGDKTLDIKSASTTTTGDYIISMYYDPTAELTKAKRWTDPNGTGVTGTPLPDISFEDVGYLWEAGTLLWERNLSTSPRTIKTSVGTGSFINFSTASLVTYPTLSTYMNAGGATSNLITWVTGSDVNIGTASPYFRSRTVKVESIDSTARVWKLGDIINSTPRLMSWTPLNNFGSRYADATYGTFDNLENPADASHFVTTTAYKSRGVVFAGGNDGMMHAFKLGTLQLNWSGKTDTQKARLVVDPTSGTLCSAGTTTVAPTCGQELWAFIPKNTLPYLKYMADPSYCHLNAVDLTPMITDASIGAPTDTADTTRTASSWRSILIGGMRFGGACKSFSNSCTTATCVKNPVNDVGYSSYFAIDVTDPLNPSLLWEFSDADIAVAGNKGLGFTTSGPAIVRINGSDVTKNGHWFVVFGSGPTGPISTTDHQFLGQSDQNLKLYVLDLKTGPANMTVIDTGISNAFAGSLFGATLDADDRDYQDEVVYIPYVKKDTLTGTWTKGGVGRLITKRNADPTQWQWSVVMDDIGPVTAAVAKISDKSNGKLWLYFGEGRYYYLKSDSSDDPDPSVSRRLFGIKDPCLSKIISSTATDVCTSSDTVLFSSLSDVTGVTPTSTPPSEPATGWFVSLDPKDTPTPGLNAERDITDPLATSAGVVYFTTYKPTSDLCTPGGYSFIWVFKYDTGGIPTNLFGKALVQVSTGAIEQKDLKSAFTGEGGRAQTVGRKTAAMSGKPPEMQGLSVIGSPPPVKRIVHMRER